MMSLVWMFVIDVLICKTGVFNGNVLRIAMLYVFTFIMWSINIYLNDNMYEKNKNLKNNKEKDN